MLLFPAMLGPTRTFRAPKGRLISRRLLKFRTCNRVIICSPADDTLRSFVCASPLFPYWKGRSPHRECGCGRPFSVGVRSWCHRAVAHWRWGMRRRQSGRFIPLDTRDGAELAFPDGFRLTDLTLDSNDLTRLNGFDARAAGRLSCGE